MKNYFYESRCEVEVEDIINLFSELLKVFPKDLKPSEKSISESGFYTFFELNGSWVGIFVTNENKPKVWIGDLSKDENNKELVEKLESIVFDFSYTKNEEDFVLSSKFVKYNHHGHNVYVREDLKGKHRSNCLCYLCDRFNPGTEKNCKIASAVYENCVKYGIVTPVWECPEVLFKNPIETLFEERIRINSKMVYNKGHDKFVDLINETFERDDDEPKN